MKFSKNIPVFISLLLILSLCGCNSENSLNNENVKKQKPKPKNTENIVEEISSPIPTETVSAKEPFNLKKDFEIADYYSLNLLLPINDTFSEIKEQTGLNATSYIDYPLSTPIEAKNFAQYFDHYKDLTIEAEDLNSNISNIKVSDNNGNYITLEKCRNTKSNGYVKGWYDNPVFLSKFEHVTKQYINEFNKSSFPSETRDWIDDCLEHFNKYGDFYTDKFQFNSVDGDKFELSIDNEGYIYFKETYGNIHYDDINDRFYCFPNNFSFFKADGIGAGKDYENLEEALLEQAEYIIDEEIDDYVFEGNKLTVNNGMLESFTLEFERNDKEKTSKIIFTQDSPETNDLAIPMRKFFGTEIDPPNSIIIDMERDKTVDYKLPSHSEICKDNYKYEADTVITRNPSNFHVINKITLTVKDPPKN